MSLYIDKIKYILVLLHAFHGCSKTAIKISQAFPAYADLLQQQDAVLQQLGLTIEQINAIRKPDWSVIERELAWAEEEKHFLISFFDNNYPILLREIFDPPLLLFVEGDSEILHGRQVAIVGSRNPTPVGIENAYLLAKNMSDAGWSVTSGLALGIDAAAHRGALAASSVPTIAVMGAGFDHIYPKCHKNLAQEIIDNGGALVSELPLSFAPLAANFPRRNRIISGLSFGVVVVEATVRSGSLITARIAAEQGRDVFALPGSIHNPLARGCHELIQQGAKLVETVADILVELPGNIDKKDIISNVDTDNGGNGIEKIYRDLLRVIDDTVTPLDVMAMRSSLTIKEIMSMLVQLELRGLVQKVSGGYIRLSYGNIER